MNLQHLSWCPDVNSLVARAQRLDSRIRDLQNRSYSSSQSTLTLIDNCVLLPAFANLQHMSKQFRISQSTMSERDKQLPPNNLVSHQNDTLETDCSNRFTMQGGGKHPRREDEDDDLQRAIRQSLTEAQQSAREVKILDQQLADQIPAHFYIQKVTGDGNCFSVPSLVVTKTSLASFCITLTFESNV